MFLSIKEFNLHSCMSHSQAVKLCDEAFGSVNVQTNILLIFVLNN